MHVFDSVLDPTVILFFYNKEIPVRCSDLSAHNVNIYSEGKNSACTPAVSHFNK